MSKIIQSEPFVLASPDEYICHKHGNIKDNIFTLIFPSQDKERVCCSLCLDEMVEKIFPKCEKVQKYKNPY